MFGPAHTSISACKILTKNEVILKFPSRIRLRLTGDEQQNETGQHSGGRYTQWYTYFLLLLVYVIYLACGAFVFKAIEQPAEVNYSN